MGTDAVEVLRDRTIATPEAANGRVKAMGKAFKFGMRRKFVWNDPARDIELYKDRIGQLPQLDGG
jgi:hypothetical protein